MQIRPAGPIDGRNAEVRGLNAARTECLHLPDPSPALRGARPGRLGAREVAELESTARAFRK
ncbi:hypothetical protein GCM10009577_29800 [Streptomyces javensis]